MTAGQIIAGVLLFAAATAILYIWGLRKSVGQNEDLNRILLNRCGNRVVRYLKKHDTISEAEIARQIDGVKAGEFWSRKRLMVQEPEKVVRSVVDFLLKQQYIVSAGKAVYRLKKQ